MLNILDRSTITYRIPGRAIGILLLVLILLPSCVAQSSLSTTSRIRPTPTIVKPTGRGTDGTLVIVHPQAPDILNPHLTASSRNLEVGRIVYEPLASYDEKGNLVPILADGIPSRENGQVAADGKSVTWKLKSGVKWSDGQSFTADDVLFTYQYISNPDVQAQSTDSYKTVASVEVVDPLNIRVKFKQVNPAWATPFVGIDGIIIPRHIFGSYNGKNAKDSPNNNVPVGTGPYRVVVPAGANSAIKPQEVLIIGGQLVKTNKIVFEPNPFYREPDKPAYSRLEWRGGIDAAEGARLVFQDGSAQYVYSLNNLSLSDLAQVQQGTKGKLLSYYRAQVERIMLNRVDPVKEAADGSQVPHPILGDTRVRKAIAYAINRNQIAAIYGPSGRATFNNLVNPPQYNSPQKMYDYNPDQAKELLDAAGWKDTNGDGIREKDGVKLHLVSVGSNTDLVNQTQKIMKDNLLAVGIDLDVRLKESSVILSKGADNPDSEYRFNADLLEIAFNSISPDPASYMGSWTTRNIPQKSNNWVGLNIERWNNPEYDKLLDQAQSELDPQKRVQLFIQMNDMLIEDVVMIPIIDLATVSGVSRSVGGVAPTPWDRQTWNIQDWRQVTP